MKTPVDYLSEQLQGLRERFGKNLDKIGGHETQIYELRLTNTEIAGNIKEHEEAIIRLKGK